METLNTSKPLTKPKKYGLGLRSKFLFVLLGSTVICILVTAYGSLSLSKNALDHSLNQQLVSLRSSRVEQVQTYFREKSAQMSVFSTTPSVIDAMRGFSASMSLLEHYNVSPKLEELSKLITHYQTNFVPQLEAINGEVSIANQYVPKGNVGRYLQYHYIVNNPAPIGDKQLFEFAEDGSYYSDLHRKYHPNMLKILEGFGFYDLFFIDPIKSTIVYSVFKELDFATSLKHGPYSNTKLANIVRSVVQDPVKGKVIVSDFQSYEPSLGQAAGFLATPIFDGSEFLGVLAAQVPISKLSDILTDHKNWVRDGLGETGEVYLVGSDRLMRSDSRFLNQATSKEKASSEAAPIPPSSILKQMVSNEAVTDAIRGNTGIINTEGYQDYPVISAYAPLNVRGLDWVVVAEKGQEEALEPITNIQKALLTGGSITVAIMTLYGLLVSNVFVGPLQSVLSHAEKLISGEKTVPLNSKRRDEFGLLTQDMNIITDLLNNQQQQNREQRGLLKERLLMIFPQAIADRFDNGHSLIADVFHNVAVIEIHFFGFSEASQDLTAQDTVKMLNQIIKTFDEATQNHGVDRITSKGNSYLAASGLMNPRLDYARNAVAFAEEVLLSLKRFNIAYGNSLSAKIAISSGDVTAGVIGKQKPIYTLMGATVATASILAKKASSNSIRIDAPVYNQLLETGNFALCDIISEPQIGEIANWEKLPQTTKPEQQA